MRKKFRVLGQTMTFSRIPRPLLRNILRVFGVMVLISIFALLFSTQPEMNIDDAVAKMTQSSAFQSPLSIPEAAKGNEVRTAEEVVQVQLKECNKLEWGLPPADDTLLQFQAVPSSDAFVRSAFYDKRLDSPNITILGLATMKTKELYCLFKYPDSDTTISVRADIEVIPEAIAPFCRFKAAVFTCINPNPAVDPHYISVTKFSCAKPEVQMPLEIIHPFETPKHKFGVCMQALFDYRTEDAGYLIEHIETNKLLGADQIFVYGVYNISRVIKSVLSYYIREGTLIIMPWDLPMKSLNKWQLQDPHLKLPPKSDPKDKTFKRNPGCVRQYAHYLANLHCMYYNMNEFKYLFYMDVDEYIVPQRHSNWHDLFQHLEHQPGYEGYASLLFREAQFCDPKTKDAASSMYFHTTAYQRLSEVKPPSKSPKPAVRPKRVTRVHVNNAKVSLPGYFREMVVDPALAKKHVYKKQQYCHDKTIQDRTMEQFKGALLPKINRVANEAGVP